MDDAKDLGSFGQAPIGRSLIACKKVVGAVVVPLLLLGVLSNQTKINSMFRKIIYALFFSAAEEGLRDGK